jgi:hypothetical protein
VGSEVPVEGVIATDVVAAVVIVIIVAGSEASFVAVAGTLLILVAVESSLVTLMDSGRPVFIAALVAVVISNGRGVTNP